MSRERDEFTELIRAGERQRAAAFHSWKKARIQGGMAAAAAGRAARRAEFLIRWGGLAAISTGLLFRIFRVRRSLRMARWVWSLLPALSRLFTRRGSRDA